MDFLQNLEYTNGDCDRGETPGADSGGPPSTEPSMAVLFSFFASSLHDDVVSVFGQKRLSHVRAVCGVPLLSEVCHCTVYFSTYLLLATVHARTFNFDAGSDVLMAHARHAAALFIHAVQAS